MDSLERFIVACPDLRHCRPVDADAYAGAVFLSPPGELSEGGGGLRS
jgi:hypothetical protein